MQLRLATCLDIPEADVDEAPLVAACRRAGVEPLVVAWDDPAVDWTAPVPTVLRSTWNYVHHVDAFRAWIDRVAAHAPLFNPPAVVHATLHKRYLLELAARGVRTAPTTLVARGAGLDLAGFVRGAGCARFVVKPAVGAGSVGTRAFAADQLADAASHLAALTAAGDALVQPFVASVEQYGERSLVWIDGDFSHAIRKTPRFAGDDERIEGPFPIADDERATAAAALAPYTSQILYGRVDLARDDAGQPMVMELEMIEPSLFFARQDGAADRFVAGLRRRLA